jgi:hypothetical protein
MNSAICTLFEGDYHRGVGALANSLFARGYRGTIYAGYRGPLPPWAVNAKIYDGFAEFHPLGGLVLRFIPLATKIHLTNFKPDFMLSLLENHCPQARSLFYFDPDITVLGRWSFFVEWVQAGVALCADINPSMPANHPLRHAWKQFYLPHGINFRRELELYFNGGFVGLKREHVEFLHCWRRLQELMTPEIGGLQNVNLRDRTYLFCKTDQDALNVAAMASESPVSPMGQDAMDLQHGGGGYVMSHAVGGVKPWRKRMLAGVLARGHAPSRADKNFYAFARQPVPVFSKADFLLKKLDLRLASAIGRYVGK